MTEWSHGYSAEETYTFGGYRELSPEWLDTVALLSNCAGPRGGRAGFRYLELGCGQGFGLILLAACYPDAEFVGIDFAPAHIAHAESLVAAAGLTNVRFVEADFAVLAERWPEDLGRFEYVVAHGIYSWVSSVLRVAVRRNIAHATAPGALVYVSYNALPGKLPMLPFQHLARRLQRQRRLDARTAMHEGIGLIDALAQGGAAANKALPTLRDATKALLKHDVSYLSHEYLHDEWQPLWFSQVSDDMAAAKLDFVGSATLSELLLPGVLPDPLKDIVARTTDRQLQQEVVDCAINQGFRRDVYIRGRHDSAWIGDGGQHLALHKLRTPDADPLRIKTSFSEMGLARSVVDPLVAMIEAKPRTLTELTASRPGAPPPLKQLILLVEHGILGIGRVGVAPNAIATRLNRTIAAMVARGAPYRRLAAPVLGSTIGVERFDMLMLDAWFETQRDEPEFLAAEVLDRLAALGATPLDDQGVKLDAAALRDKSLTAARAFTAEKLPRWQALGVIG